MVSGVKTPGGRDPVEHMIRAVSGYAVKIAIRTRNRRREGESAVRAVGEAVQSLERSARRDLEYGSPTASAALDGSAIEVAIQS